MPRTVEDFWTSLTVMLKTNYATVRREIAFVEREPLLCRLKEKQILNPDEEISRADLKNLLPKIVEELQCLRMNLA